MKNCYLLLFLLSNLSILNAQDYSLDFGRISQKEADLQSCPEDTAASAVVLYDIGNSYFIHEINGNILCFERSTKIKIFKKSGFKYATIEIPFYKELDFIEQIVDIEAYTYNYINYTLQKTELKKDQIFEKKEGKYNYKKVFTLPDIQEGSIIEFRYKIRSPFLFKLHNWEFQSTIPVNYSKYRVRMESRYDYTFLLQGKNKFDEYNKLVENKGEAPSIFDANKNTKSDIIHEYIMKNVPAFEMEEYITSIDNYIIKLEFQLNRVKRPDGTTTEFMTTWPRLCNDLLKHEWFGIYVNSCERKAEEILQNLNITDLSANEKVKIITTYVKRNYKWNRVDEKLAYEKVKDFLDTKTGNSANINLFLLALLNKAGIEALPIILSTREHGKIKTDYPFESYFNYVAVLVNLDGKVILTDATEPLLPYFLIPPRCLNDKGLVIKKNTEQWVDLSNNIPSGITYNFNLEFNNDLDSLKGLLSYSSTLYDAFDLRCTINDKDENKLKFVENKSYVLASDVKTSNFFEIDRPYTIAFKAAVPIVNVNNKLYINPFLQDGISKNLFVSETRKYPIDFIYAQKRSYNINIKIPDNYKVISLPAATKSESELATLNYEIQENSNYITVKADYHIKNPVYQPGDYEGIKSVFSELVKKMNESIVFEKIN